MDVLGGCVAFLRQFFSATAFLCRFFFQFTDALFRSILPIFAANTVYFIKNFVYFIKKSNSVLATKVW